MNVDQVQHGYHLPTALCSWMCALTCVWAVGCAGALRQPPLAKAYFVIDPGHPDTSTQKSATLPSAGLLRIGRLRVSPPYDEVAFVYRIGPSQFDIDRYNNFLAPPASLLTGALIQWLDQAGPPGVVDSASSLRSNLRLEGNIAALYVDTRDKSAMRAVIVGRFLFVKEQQGQDNVVFEMPFEESASVAAQSPANFSEALGQAWRQVLIKLTAKVQHYRHGNGIGVE